MKKKLWLIPVCIPAVLLLVGAAGLWWMASHSMSFSTGRCLAAENGAYLLILDGSPIVMSDESKDGELFSGLENGDEILILHDGIRESYPGGTGAYAVWKLESGDLSDIPETVLHSLTKLGWWSASDVQPGGNTAPGDIFDIRVAWVNWSDAEEIAAAALNTQRLTEEDSHHLPIFQFETPRELENFRSDFGACLAMEDGYDEVPSFTEITGTMDEAFFEEYTVFAVYVTANSASYRFDVNSVFHDSSEISIQIQQANDPEVLSTDMAGWLVTVALPKDMSKNCSIFDAELIDI